MLPIKEAHVVLVLNTEVKPQLLIQGSIFKARIMKILNDYLFLVQTTVDNYEGQYWW